MRHNGFKNIYTTYNMINAYQAWLALSLEERRTILSNIAAEKKVDDRAIEKDYWVSVVLHAIFSQPYGKHFVFKGGTSLSKGWNLIARFSEDIDLAIDREYLGFTGMLNKSQRTKLRKQSKLFIEQTLAIDSRQSLADLGLSDWCQVDVPEEKESDKDPVVLYVRYKSIIESLNPNPYMLDVVKIEISCRSMLEPYEAIPMRSMVADYYSDEEFAEPAQMVQTVLPQRTFLEKIFLLHEEYTRTNGLQRCDRLTRHIYDIVQMMDKDFAKDAIHNQELYRDIVKHRQCFTAWSGLDYHTHSPQTICIIPPAEALPKLEEDYKRMQTGFIYGQSPSFAYLMERLTELQQRFRALDFDIEL